MNLARKCRLRASLAVMAVLAAGAEAPSGGGVWASDEDVRVGVGDARSGYDAPGYRSDSRSVEIVEGSAANLVGLVAEPPLGLPPVPGAESVTTDAVDLGRRLFFDRRLSFNGTLSCAMCHVPEQGFTQNELRTPVGIEGRIVKRNAPSVYNVGYRKALFHDGRETSLELQIWAPLLAANEMGNPSIGSVLARIDAVPGYREAFLKAFGDGVTVVTVGRALAAYQRALLSADSAFDRWLFGGVQDAIDDAAKRGFELFVEHDCSSCHWIETGYAHFTDDAFHDTGIGYRAAMSGRVPSTMQIAPGIIIDIDSDIAVPKLADLGRYEATGSSSDRWKYRTPTLRNAAVTAPYMHDGSIATLAGVVAFYDRGGVPHEGLDPRIRPLGLSGDEKAQLVKFLESLTGSNVDALAADARSSPIGDR